MELIHSRGRLRHSQGKGQKVRQFGYKLVVEGSLRVLDQKKRPVMVMQSLVQV